MSGMENLYVSPKDALRRAMEVINNGRKGMALVVDGNGRLLGTLTDGDVRRHLLNGGGRDDPVEVFYCREPIVAEVGFDRTTVKGEMERRGVSLVPLVENGRPVNLLTKMDVTATDRPAILGGRPVFERPFPVARPTLPPFEELSEELRGVLAGGLITNGPQVEAFEAEAAAWMEVEPERAIALSNCTTGLILALSMLKTPGEVIMPSFTYFATGLAATWNSLTPVFVEARPTDFNVDPSAVEAEINERTRAIVGVYIFGCPPPVAELRRLADEHKIPLVLDAAHAFGSFQDDVPAGRFGDLEVFSLSPTKPVTAGEGGLIICRDVTVAADIRRRRNLGLLDSATDSTRGLNGRMSEFNAVLGRASLKHLKGNLEMRHRLTDLYRDELRDVPGLGFQELPDGAISTYKDFAVIIDTIEFGMSRDDLAEGLTAENIGIKKYFSPPLHLQRRFAGLSRTAGELKTTERLSNSVLCLPLYSHQRQEDVRKIASAVKRLVKHSTEVNRKLVEFRHEWE